MNFFRCPRSPAIAGLFAGFVVGASTGAEAQFGPCPDEPACMRKLWDGTMSLRQYRNRTDKAFCHSPSGQRMSLFAYPQDGRFPAGICLDF
jgi:hypothetical protein